MPRVIRTLVFMLVTLQVIVLVVFGGKFLSDALRAVRYPFELAYGEGLVLAETKRFVSGEAIYHSISEPPYVVSNYPPLYYAVTGVLDVIVKNTLAAGRLVSVASTLTLSLLLGWSVWRAVGSDIDRLPRALASAVGGLTFLAIRYTHRWGVLMRVDMLALMLAFAGVLAFGVWALRPGKGYWPLLLFLLAAYTKHSILTAPLACILVATVIRPASGLKFGAILAAAGLGLFVLVNAQTDGQFYFHLVTASARAYDWKRAAGFALLNIKNYPIFLAVSALTAVLLVSSQYRILLRGRRTQDPFAPRFSWEKSVLGVYWVIAFLVTLAAGQTGASSNYFLEFMAIGSALIGIATSWLFAALEGKSTEIRLPAWRALALATLLPILLIVQLLKEPVAGAEDTRAKTAQRLGMEQLLQLVRQTHGPMLSEDMTLVTLGGKEVEIDPFMMTQLTQIGLWDQRKLLNRIDSKEFALVVLGFDLHSVPQVAYRRFSPEVLAALRRSYEFLMTAGELRVYAPK